MTHALHAVLVVEDDDDSRDALVAVLEAYGYVVCEATDGQDALDRLKAGYRPCSILLDLMMPRMDGWEFRERQRGDPELAKIPVALLTAAANIRLHASRLGAEAFAKPIDLDRVIAFIEGHCAEPQ
jgi:CheY-like chemotaxis protein